MTVRNTPEQAEVPPPKLEEVSDGVFGYVQLDGSWGLNNTGFIVGSDAVTAIDTCFTERRTRAFLAAIRNVSQRPLRTLINTHHHGDHTHGNFLLLPTTSIIAHERCRQEVQQGGLTTTAIFPGVEWGDIEIAPPFVTFEDRLNVYVDDLKVELIFVGPAHTTNDIVAWIPERSVLFTGDVVFNQGTPFALMGSLAGWLTALETLRRLRPGTVVPGHGPICGPEVFDDVEAYLRFVQDKAGKGSREGISPLEAARGTSLGRFGEWLDKERLVGNLHRAYSELLDEPAGAPLDYPKIIGDMIAYNGGQPLRCLA
jgi:cyclase